MDCKQVGWGNDARRGLLDLEDLQLYDEIVLGTASFTMSMVPNRRALLSRQDRGGLGEVPPPRVLSIDQTHCSLII